MKFLKIILSILIFISPANANTIYYLIKIPNLEIHTTKSVNGLKYLKAVKPFEVGIKDIMFHVLIQVKKILKKNCPQSKKI